MNLTSQKCKNRDMSLQHTNKSLGNLHGKNLTFKDLHIKRGLRVALASCSSPTH